MAMKKPKNEKPKNEKPKKKLKQREIEELMGTKRDTYKRKNGAVRRR